MRLKRVKDWLDTADTDVALAMCALGRAKAQYSNGFYEACLVHMREAHRLDPTLGEFVDDTALRDQIFGQFLYILGKRRDMGQVGGWEIVQGDTQVSFEDYKIEVRHIAINWDLKEGEDFVIKRGLL
jgi:hypothetical protein